MLARLYNDRTEYQKPEILEACRIGMDFLRKHACTDDGRVFFSLTEDGKVNSTKERLCKRSNYAWQQYALQLRYFLHFLKDIKQYYLVSSSFHRFS